ncbi:MAG: TetR/AcrR family transcriptional regulator [Eubacteriales bacterium]|nr:TetR/AcrR family transcriptional regulator [Eubacteriales bacterium]
MSGQTLDPRSRKTRDAILQTFKNMLTEMDLSQITIKKLTERVGINRKTFYHHYNHIEDLILDMQNQLISASLDYFRPSIENKDFHTFFKNNFLFWAKEIDFIYTFFSRKDLETIYGEFTRKEIMSTNFKEIWPELKHPEIVQAYTFGATNYLFSYWYTNGKPLPIEEFAELGANLIINGLSSALDFDSES